MECASPGFCAHTIPFECTVVSILGVRARARPGAATIKSTKEF